MHEPRSWSVGEPASAAGVSGYAAGARILEVGCGVGARTATLAQHSPGSDITAIDVAPGALDRARERLAAVDHDATVTFRQADHLPAGRRHRAAPRRRSAGHRDLRPRRRLLRARAPPRGVLPPRQRRRARRRRLPGHPAAPGRGDALIGRRLQPLLAASGFQEVVVSPRLVYVDAGIADLLCTAEADGTFHYTFFKATGRAPS